MSKRVQVDHLARVEGHGRINVEVSQGEIRDLQFSIFEGPRFFESLTVGRNFKEVHSLMARICSICSCGHKITSILAVEDALDITPSHQTKLLRELYFHGMFIESHVLHLFFLALPDYLGYESAIAMTEDYPDEVEMALRLKKLGNDIQTICSGRELHGENPVVGGFGRFPGEEELSEVRERLQSSLGEVEKTVELFDQLDYPAFTIAPTLFYAVEPEGDVFSYFGNRIKSSRDELIDKQNYRSVCDERVMEYSSAKQSLPGGEAFMVGALARVNLFGNLLTPKTHQLVQTLNTDFPSENSLHNNLAQAIETMYSFERAINIIDELTRTGINDERPPEIMPRAGHGIAVTEVPRGTLYHEYEIDDEGKITRANVVTPTAQNQANIEKDFHTCVQQHPEKSDEQLQFDLEMIARAYDPCISCAAHLVELNKI